MRKDLRVLSVMTIAASLFSQSAVAGVAKIDAVGKRAQVTVERGKHLVGLSVGDSLEAGDKLITGPDTAVDLRLEDETLIRVGVNSTYIAEEDSKVHRLVHNLIAGVVRVLVPTSKESAKSGSVKFRLNTPEGTIGVRGTEFVVMRKAESTELYGLSGNVLFGPEGADFSKSESFIEVGKGFSSSVGAKNKTPTKPLKFSLPTFLGEIEGKKGPFSPLVGRVAAPNLKLREVKKTGLEKAKVAEVQPEKPQIQRSEKAVTPVALSVQDALFAAAEKGDVEAAKRALIAGAKINAKNAVGLSALAIAVDERRIKMIETLLAKGAEVNTVDKHGRTPIFYVAQKPAAVAIAQMLVKAKADLNVSDEEGRTPLMMAVISADEAKGASGGPEELVMGLFLDNGAEVNAVDKTGNTALHVAVELESPAHVVELLLDSDADLKLTNKLGQTAVVLARERNLAAILKLLEEKNGK